MAEVLEEVLVEAQHLGRKLRTEAVDRSVVVALQEGIVVLAVQVWLQVVRGMTGGRIDLVRAARRVQPVVEEVVERESPVVLGLQGQQVTSRSKLRQAVGLEWPVESRMLAGAVVPMS